MPYKDKNKQIESYYKNREKRLEYQRRYDKEHKETKSSYDKKRRHSINYNKIKSIQHYSLRKHYPKLIKQICKCQICGSKKKLEIHHKRYTKKLSDCMLICQECHKKLHRKNHLTFTSFSPEEAD